MLKYELKYPFDFSARGTKILIDFINIKAPTAKIQKLCSTIHVEFSKASKKALEDISKIMEGWDKEEVQKLQEEAAKKADLKSKESKEESVMADDDVIQVLKSADLSIMHEALRKILITSGMVELPENDLSLTSAVYDEIPYKELHPLLVFYIANFIAT